MAVRTVVHIDEEKCDGCGLCVPGCEEGALRIVNGKAKLVSDVYCDGLGECLGHCPQGAITLIEREAAEFDEKAVKEKMTEKKRNAPSGCGGTKTPGQGSGGEVEKLACGCPGTLARKLERGQEQAQETREAPPGFPQPSRLENWPVQIGLVPVQAPWLEGADLVIAADCAPFAYGDFHRRFLPGKVLMIGCPKFDDVQGYVEKLAAIFREKNIRSIHVVHMEVPCCNGLINVVRKALEKSGRNIPTTLFKVGVKGDFVEERILPGAAA